MSEVSHTPLPCPCTLVEQDESCPVGYPSLLCEDCNGKGILTSSMGQMTRPTPIPWSYEEGVTPFYNDANGYSCGGVGTGYCEIFRVNDAGKSLWDADGELVVVDVFSVPNARFIVDAVNSHAALQEYALEITKTLTGLSGGGSEMFDGKIGEMFKADLPRCAERIRSRHDSVHAQLVEQKKTAAALQERVRRLEEAVRQASECLCGEPLYHYEGMGCGLEDRNITDRYEAMEHGWECALERVYGEHINGAREILDAALGKEG